MPEQKNEKPDETQSGLLYPDPDIDKPGFAPHAHSDAALHKEAAEHPETVMEAATESHHGVLREAAHTNSAVKKKPNWCWNTRLSLQPWREL
jgi:hypothetical protein